MVISHQGWEKYIKNGEESSLDLLTGKFQWAPQFNRGNGNCIKNGNPQYKTRVCQNGAHKRSWKEDKRKLRLPGKEKGMAWPGGGGAMGVGVPSNGETGGVKSRSVVTTDIMEQHYLCGGRPLEGRVSGGQEGCVRSFGAAN